MQPGRVHLESRAEAWRDKGISFLAVSFPLSIVLFTFNAVSSALFLEPGANKRVSLSLESPLCGCNVTDGQSLSPSFTPIMHSERLELECLGKSSNCCEEMFLLE